MVASGEQEFLSPVGALPDWEAVGLVAVLALQTLKAASGKTDAVATEVIVVQL